ncbi:MAG: GNAT family N-acetyltransferase [Pseudomonadota bacterium]
MIKNSFKTDTTIYSTRLLTVGDTHAITQHFLGLPVHDQYSRFCGTISRLSIERFVERCIVRQDHVFLGYSVGEALIGVAQLAPSENPAAGSELALSVDPHFRRLGVASELTKEAIKVAVVRNVPRLWVSTVIENRSMIELAKKFGFLLHTSSFAISGYLCLPSRDFVSSVDMGAHPLQLKCTEFAHGP